MQIIYMVLGRLTENTQKNENRNRNFENEIPKQTMDSVATVVAVDEAHAFIFSRKWRRRDSKMTPFVLFRKLGQWDLHLVSILLLSENRGPNIRWYSRAPRSMWIDVC